MFSDERSTLEAPRGLGTRVRNGREREFQTFQSFEILKDEQVHVWERKKAIRRCIYVNIK